jgi:hypothetical protein
VIAASGVDDVRDVLDHYNQESDPIEAFLIRQQALLVRFGFSFYFAKSFCFSGSRRTETTGSSRREYTNKTIERLIWKLETILKNRLFSLSLFCYLTKFLSFICVRVFFFSR